MEQHDHQGDSRHYPTHGVAVSDLNLEYLVNETDPTNDDNRSPDAEEDELEILDEVEKTECRLFHIQIQLIIRLTPHI